MGFLYEVLVFNAVRCVLSSFVIIWLGKRELVALLLLSSGCQVVVTVRCIFLPVPRVGLQHVIATFPGHTRDAPKFLIFTKGAYIVKFSPKVHISYNDATWD